MNNIRAKIPNAVFLNLHADNMKGNKEISFVSTANQIRQFFTLIILCACFFITDSRADTYQASHEYYTKVKLTAPLRTITIGPMESFSAAAQLAWDYWKVPDFWPDEVKVDWYADRIYPMCRTKTEPDFTEASIHIEIYSSTLNTENGGESCSSTFNTVRIQHTCPYGGHLGFTKNDGNICFDAPFCSDDKIRNPITGECEVSPKNAGQTCENDLFQGNPINIAVGNKYQREVDYRANGSFPLTVSRSYNSVTNSWRFFPEIGDVSAGVTVNVISTDGKGHPFRKESGVWDTDADIVDTLTTAEDGSGNITGWTHVTRNDKTETYDAQGRILSVTDRSGISHTYSYQTDSITVTHTNGNTLIYHLDSAGKVIGFTDPDNRDYQYIYDAQSRLISIAFPDDTPADTTDNPKRVYHYEDNNFPHALTGITDENGNRYATWTYDSEGRAISSEHANGVDKTTLTYNADGTTTVTNPLGKQTTYHFTTIQGVRKVTQVEGHPTASCEGANKAYSYDANGNVTSKTDWNGVTTTYTYDMDRNLELSRTEASGTPQARTITIEWHPVFRLPTKITEPGKVTEYSYDAQGRRLSGNVRGEQ